MVGSIKIRVHAHNPSLPLTEAVSYIGSPSSVFVYDVPKKIGTWQITDVAVSVYYPDNSFATVAAKMSAEGVWVATIPACDLSGRIRNGFRILASGTDEDGAPVSGYVLGVGDLAVCKLFPAPAPDPGEKAYILRYFDAAPASPKKGDVAPIDDAIKFYDGTQWVAFGSDVDLSDYYTKEETDALFDDYYTKDETDEAIDRLAAYYITYNAAGAAFPTRAALLNAQTYYSGGVVRTPTRNDYAVVLADETHDGAEYRYIYAVADGETVGQWEAQYPIETNDYTALSNKPKINNVELTGNKTSAELGIASTADATLNERGYTAWELSEYTAPAVSGPIVIRADGSAWYPCLLRVCGAFKSIDSSTTSVTWAAGEWTGGYPMTAERANASSTWVIITPQALQDGYEIYSSDGSGPIMPVHPENYGNVKGNTQSTSLTWRGSDSGNPEWPGTTDLTATRTALSGYQLGSQSDKPLASEAEAEALRTGKVSKSGDTMTGGLTFNTQATTAVTANADIHLYDQAMLTIDDGMTLGEGSTADYLATQIQHKPDGANDYFALQFPEANGKIAIAASNPTAGNLAALDANGNATDSGIAPSDIPTEADFHYALGPTITASATLADRAMNKVEPLDTNTDDIELSFPPATNGKARDFLVLINNPTGNTGAITFDPPAGATIYGDGLEQTFAEGETWEVTITEVAKKQFYCKAVKMEASVVPPPYWGLYFEAEEDNVVVSATVTDRGGRCFLEKSTDGETWTEFVYVNNYSSTRVSAETLAAAGDRVYIRARPTYGPNASVSAITFTLTGKAGAGGNIMSLFDGTDEDNVTLTGNNCCRRLFSNCASLTSAPSLPATTLTSHCYDRMFQGCTSLTQPPKLPATTLAEGCYYGMFYGCASLTKAPALNATTATVDCYHEMFCGCTSLTTAPALPATTVAADCYNSMFNGCTALTAAPNLPATAVTNNSYREMFRGCSSLASISVALTSWTDSWGYNFDNWVNGVATSGTFTCPAALGTNANIARGVSRCPSGWTVVNV